MGLQGFRLVLVWTRGSVSSVGWSQARRVTHGSVGAWVRWWGPGAQASQASWAAWPKPQRAVMSSGRLGIPMACERPASLVAHPEPLKVDCLSCTCRTAAGAGGVA